MYRDKISLSLCSPFKIQYPLLKTGSQGPFFFLFCRKRHVIPEHDEVTLCCIPVIFSSIQINNPIIVREYLFLEPAKHIG